MKTKGREARLQHNADAALGVSVVVGVLMLIFGVPLFALGFEAGLVLTGNAPETCTAFGALVAVALGLALPCVTASGLCELLYRFVRLDD